MNNEYPENLKRFIPKWKKSMNEEQLKQFIIQRRRLREHDWHDMFNGKWIQDDESSLSNMEIQELIMEFK